MKLVFKNSQNCPSLCQSQPIFWGYTSDILPLVSPQNGMTCGHIAAAKGSAAVISELMRFNKHVITAARNKVSSTHMLPMVILMDFKTSYYQCWVIFYSKQRKQYSRYSARYLYPITLLNILLKNSLLYSNITQEHRKILANHFTIQMYFFVIIFLICIFTQC